MLVTTTPKYEAADATAQKVFANAGGVKIFYAVDPSDLTGEADGSLEPGESLTATKGYWFATASGSSDLTVRPRTTREELEDEIYPSGTFPGAYVGGWHPVAATSGTDIAFAEKQLFTGSVFLPFKKTITGIAYLLGAEGGTNKVIAALFDSAGNKVANSSETTEGTVAGTKETIQKLAFTSTYEAEPGLYYVGITGNGTTAKLRTIPAQTASDNTFADKIEIATKNSVPASITVPTTFTAAEAPVAMIY